MEGGPGATPQSRMVVKPTASGTLKAPARCQFWCQLTWLLAAVSGLGGQWASQVNQHI
jgi:hypothetical protein